MEQLTKTFAAILVISTLTTLFAFSQAPTNGLVAYYPFNDNAIDASGNNRDGGIVAGGYAGVIPTTDRFGVANRAYAFNGLGGHITVSNWNILAGNAPRTMMLWFKTSVSTTSSNFQSILSWGGWLSDAFSRIVIRKGGSGILGFDESNANQLFVRNQFQYYDNQWHLIAVTFDGSTLNLYLDGVSLQNKTTTLNTSSNSFNYPSNLIIGSDESNGFFTGSLDDVRIYNRALTANEVQQTYVVEAPTTSTAEIIKLGADRFIHTAGTDNTFVGLRAGGFGNSIGSTFVGKNTGINNIGSHNAFYGLNAGSLNTTGGKNTFLGKGTGEFNTAGSENVFNGFEAGKLNTTGSFNLYIGSSANGFGANAASLQRAAAVGYNARVSINDAIVLGDFQNNNVKVGIGVHDPQHRLDVKGVINMRAALNSPGLKINGRDFLGLDEQGEFIVSNFKMKYQSENQWADRVFKKGYILMPLAQLDEYIQEHGHLPGIPTASEAVDQGVSTQEITAKLLEKVEELTRYVIELKKENESLKKDYQEVLKRLPAGNK
ncbi:LamG domain-containing protein [Runella aurantiaca]|uniref:LamG domain-containing protein n=1 Tax=Runella aurantiaca TaxID=2282308 RepID=A0A369I9R6_9BACT|nr:LamG domain-containing protein [Runella aurantiaca]RDB05620.1 LamG domain-containing protein [Runella aurantiaca]